MDKYRKAFLAAAILFSIPSSILLILSLVSFNIGGIPLIVGCMAWWLMYYYLIKSSKIAFWLSFAMVNIFWWSLLIGFIQRASYEIQSRDNYDIFSVFSEFFVFEIFIFLPLTIVLVFGVLAIIGFIRAGKAAEENLKV